MQNTDAQGLAPGNWLLDNRPRNDTNPVPELISKKWLANRMGCMMPCGKLNRRRFYDYVLTKEICEVIGMTQKEVRGSKFRTFTREQSVLLTQKLFL